MNSNKKFNEYKFENNIGFGYRPINYSSKEFFIFDIGDYDLINYYCWRPDDYGYWRTQTYPYSNRDKQYVIKLHRLIVSNYLKINIDIMERVDHENRNPSDNRKENLRLVTNSQNSRNASVGLKNISGIIGVCFDKRGEKWRAYIFDNNRQISLGYYDTFDEAVKARLLGEIKYYKEFAPQKHLFEQYGLSY